MKRNIIKIDEALCTGCGACVPDCPEGALAIVDGKARIVKESLCDGLGACVGRCPYGALTLEVRETTAFDEAAARENTRQARRADNSEPCSHGTAGCPGGLTRVVQPAGVPAGISAVAGASALRQWPVQLKLLNPEAPYFRDADIVVAADCVAFSFARFHERFLAGRTVIVFCPKLDNARQEYIGKLTEIFSGAKIRSVTVVRMEVPCCSATTAMVEEALKRSGARLVIRDYTVSLRGEIV